MYKYISVFIIALLSIVSCNNNQRNDTLIAQVGDKFLYISDLTDIFPQDITADDSIKLISNYANRWARKQLILRKAENNLSTNEKNVSAELDDYRASLLIFRYEQAYIMQRMDTLVRISEIESFYEKNKDNYQLMNSLLKAIYVKVPNDAPILKQIRGLYRSGTEKDMSELENLCYQGAVNYDYFNNEWIDFSVLSKELPLDDTKNYENELINKRFIETNDQQFTYLISIRDIKVKGSVAPFEHVKDNIRNIILNKRKQDMIKSLENEIYNEALNHNDLKFNIENNTP